MPVSPSAGVSRGSHGFRSWPQVLPTDRETDDEPGCDEQHNTARVTDALPDNSEQRHILSSIGIETVDLNRAIRNAERETQLLREFRIRLIADVVTGKLDVCEAAAQLPDEAAELDSPNDTESEVDSDEPNADDAEVLEQAEA